MCIFKSIFVNFCLFRRKIKLKFNGNGLVDWFTNIITDVSTFFLKGIIINLLEKQVHGGFENLIEKINQDIKNIIN